MKIMKIIILLYFFIIELCQRTDIGAYKSVPDFSNLQFRFGNGLGYIGNDWDDAKMAKMSSLAGDDTQRKKLPESHFDTWGFEIEVGDCQSNTEYGILDVVGYLSTPTKAHSGNASSDNENCYPANLYEPIWLSNGSVNPDNYWANYVNKTVSIYKDYIKIWETWNEPDYTGNTGATDLWYKSPPNASDLTHWYGSIFQYIRLLRITYEVAKKADPNCFVATGGLGYPSFVDAIMRYTDEPNEGKVTDEYPAYGGAYFDCEAYHQYPQYGVTDLETGEGYHDSGSDTLVKKLTVLKKNHDYIIKKYGFGSKYPKKLYINTETGLRSKAKNGIIGGDLMRRNYILKSVLYCLEYEVKQYHMLVLSDGTDDGGLGDYGNLGKFVSYEEGLKVLKDSTKGRLTLQKMHIGKFVFDEEKTKELRNKLSSYNATGIVLKRQFPKEENETFYAKYIYSAWMYCQSEEVNTTVSVKLNLPYDMIQMDWLGNTNNVGKNDEFTLTSTPIFFLGEKEITKTSTVVIVFAVLGGIVGCSILVIGGLFIYKRFIKGVYFGNQKLFSYLINT